MSVTVRKLAIVVLKLIVLAILIACVHNLFPLALAY
jgi:hypothetical protein